MNPGQKMFYEFFMERVQEGKEEEAKALLLKNFELVKPEAVGELKDAMAHFGSRL